MTDALPVFIGFDDREAVAADVCRHSLLRHSSIPLHVQFLRMEMLQYAGLYRRTYSIEAGQMVDDIDERPFSTKFSFTRFLVPALMQYSGWAFFVDADFLFRADIAELIPLLDDSYALMCTQQHYVPRQARKMDGCVQTAYPRKCWSALMAFNCGHRDNKRLSVDAVNTRPGSWLHQFQWLDPDDVGSLPAEWNWIDGVTAGTPKAIHYTLGGPWFADYEHCAYATEWRAEFDRLGRKMQEAA